MYLMKYYLKLLHFYWQYDRKFLLLRSFSLLLSPSKVFVNVFLMRYLIDSIFVYQSIRAAILIIVFITAINFTAAFYVEILYSKLVPISTLKTNAIITDKLYQSYATQEVKENKDRDALSFLILNNDSRFNDILGNLFNVGTQISGFSLVVGYLMTNSGLVIFLICISIFAINSFFLPKINKIAFKYNENNAGNQRLLNYMLRIFNAPEYEIDIENKDIRALLLHEKNFIFERSEKLALESWKKRHGLIFSQNILSNLLQSGLILAFITFQAIRNGLTVGRFTSLFNSVSQVMESTVFLSRTIPELIENSLYLEKYFTFLNEGEEDFKEAKTFEEIKILFLRKYHLILLKVVIT